MTLSLSCSVRLFNETAVFMIRLCHAVLNRHYSLNSYTIPANKPLTGFKEPEYVLMSVSREKATLTAEVSKDTELYSSFSEFEEEYTSRAAAIRAAIRKGTGADEAESQAPVGTVEAFLMSAGYISLFFAFFSVLIGAYATVAVALFIPSVSTGVVAGVAGLLALTWATVAAGIFAVRRSSAAERWGVPA
jgi:hypothetical protein